MTETSLYYLRLKCDLNQWHQCSERRWRTKWSVPRQCLRVRCGRSAQTEHCDTDTTQVNNINNSLCHPCLTIIIETVKYYFWIIPNIVSFDIPRKNYEITTQIILLKIHEIMSLDFKRFSYFLHFSLFSPLILQNYCFFLSRLQHLTWCN